MSIYEKLAAMSDRDIMIIWRALANYDPSEYYDRENNITMDDWAEAVYSERSRRGLPL